MSANNELSSTPLFVEVELANNEDLVRAEHKLISSQQVRRARIRGVVNSGAMRLALPESVAQQLGLETSGSATVRYADGRVADRLIAQNVHLAYGGRYGVYRAIVEPDADYATIGAIVLADLDFVVDSDTRSLRPRDPKQIVAEIE